MSSPGLHDALGPRAVRAPNLVKPLTLRPIVRLIGGVTCEDDPTRERTRMRFPASAFQTVTLDAGELARSPRPWHQGLSDASLVRLEPGEAGVVLEGLADAYPMGAGFYALRAVPNVPVKYLANAGAYSVIVRPLAAAPEDPRLAGPFLNAISLTPGLTVRIAWDHAAYGYRVMGVTPPPPDVPAEALLADGDSEPLVDDVDSDYLILG